MVSSAAAVRLCAVLLAVAAATVAGAGTLPPFNVGGFQWAENLAFDGQGRLFVSDAQTGTIWRIFLSADGQSYEREVHIDAFSKALGLAFLDTPPAGVTGFAVVADGGMLSRKYHVISFDPSTNDTNKYTMVADVPGGNGAGIFERDLTMFVSTEGKPLIEPGAVFRVDLSSGAVTTVLNIDGANGVAVDNERAQLHVGSLFGAYFSVYALPSLAPVAEEVPAYGMGSIDDFALASNGSVHVAADYFGNRIVASDWEHAAAAGKYVVQGGDSPNAKSLSSPTSVAWGRGRGFNASLLYVTEGGVSVRPNSRVLTLEPAAKPVLTV